LRDILTGLAILVIVALSAALAVPWFVDWSARRAIFEEQIARLTGLPTTIGGDISLRLLPDPKISLSGVRMGREGGPRLEVTRIDLVAAVAPLLRGQIRVTEAALEGPRAFLSLDRAGGLAGAGDLAANWAAPSADIAIERLTARNGVVSLFDPGAPQPLVLDGIDIEADAASLVGPWRVNGRIVVGNTPLDIRIASGSPEPGAGTRLKAVAEQPNGQRRAEIDGRVQPDPNGALAFDGRVVAGGRVRWPERDGYALRPWTLSAGLRFAGRRGKLENVELDAGGENSPIKLAGSGEVIAGATPSVSLALEAKQLDLDRPFTSQGLPPPSPAGVLGAWLGAFTDEQGSLPRLPLSLGLKVGNLLVSGEAVGGFELAGALAERRFAVQTFKATLPGGAPLAASGQASLAQGGQFSGHVSLSTRDAGRLSGWLEGERAGGAGRLSGIRELSVEADVAASPQVIAARGLQLRADRSTVQGTMRFSPAEPNARGRFEAQLISDGLAIEQVPDLSTLTTASQGLDLAVTLDARNVRVGAQGVGAGRLGIRFTTARDGLTIENLDVSDVGGASVKATGRIGPAGGRLDANIDARRVEPLAELLRKVVPGRAPALLSERAGSLSPLRLRLTMEKGAGIEAETRVDLDGTAAASRIFLNGRIGGGQGIDRVTGTARLEAPDTAPFLTQLGFPAVPLPGTGRGRLTVDLDGRFGAGATLRVAAEAAGTRITGEGRLGRDASEPDVAGTLALESADIGPLTQLLALPGPDMLGRVPASAKAEAILRGDVLALSSLTGSMAGLPFTGRLSVDSEAEKLEGELSFDKLSFPGLAALALGPLQPPLPASLWPSNRFGSVSPPPFDTTLRLAAKSLDLGGAWTASDASARLHWTEETFEIASAKASFLGGTGGGSIAIRRQGGLASVGGKVSIKDVPLAALAPASGLSGTLAGEIDGAASGETVSALVSSFSGGGQLHVRGLVLPRLAPRALPAVTNALDQEKDPPDARRVRDAITVALDRAPLEAGTVDIPVTLSAGNARMGPLSLTADAVGFQGTLALDLRTGRVEGRAALQAAAPADWTGPPPQVSVSWRTGRGGVVERELDTATLTNMLTTRAVARELERIESMEADLRERAFFNRRMKADRDRLERERREAEEARVAEEARQAEEARKAEETRRAEEARRAEDARKAEEARRAEIARRADEARLAEERRLDDVRRAEEARRAEEQRQREQAIRQAIQPPAPDNGASEAARMLGLPPQSVQPLPPAPPQPRQPPTP
jgi:hypothetical protein